jgi:predicted dehydrogenase
MMVSSPEDRSGLPVERMLEQGSLCCPGCGGRLARWGYARQRVVFGPARQGRRVRPRRSRCTACRVTHVPLPARLLIACILAAGLVLGVRNTLTSEAVMKFAPVERPVASAACSFIGFIDGAIASWLAGKLAGWYSPHIRFYMGTARVLIGLAVLASGRRSSRQKGKALRYRHPEVSLMGFSAMGKRIGVGIIGLSAKGGWAAAAHVPALRAVEGYELRALSASSAGSAEAAGEAHDVPLTFGTAEELAGRDEVDLVVVTVKVPRHRELVTTALQAGKMVLCEWPLGNGLAEAEELAAVARSRGIRTVAGLQARSAPAVGYLRDLVAGGYVGDVLSTTVIASGEGWGPEVPTPHARYLIDAANGATMLTINAGHILDAVALVLGEFGELDAVIATRRNTVRDAETGGELRMTAPDQVAVAGRLASGAVAAVHLRGGHSRGVNFHWEINGTEGDLVVSGPSGRLMSSPVQIRGGHGGDGELSVLEVPGSYHRVAGLAGQQDAPGYAVAHAYAQLLDDINSGASTLPDFDHAVQRHRTIETIGRAATSGRRQTVS